MSQHRVEAQCSSGRPPAAGAAQSHRGVTAPAGHLAAGTRVVALYNFAGESTDDLPFAKGQVLTIVAPTVDSNWYLARSDSDSAEGVVPVNYIMVYDEIVDAPKKQQQQKHDRAANGWSQQRRQNSSEAPPQQQEAHCSAAWFHGKISRERTERLLAAQRDGTFLIRESTNFPGDFTLCLAYRGGVEHYRIQRRQHRFTCDDEEFFDSLHDLVSHYKQEADGLCHRLTAAVPSEQQQAGPKSPTGQQLQRASTPPAPANQLAVDSVVDSVDGAGGQRCVSPLVQERAAQFKSAGWTIARHDLSLGDVIGKGEFGDVLVGWYGGNKVAVKALKHGSNVADSLLEEAALMTSLRHRNLVALMGIVLDDVSDVLMVTEYMTNGNLVDYLRSRGRHGVDKLHMIRFAMDVCSGMSHLESKELVHRDLAARNVLLSDQLVAKVSDFGLAKHASHSCRDTSGKFPIKWTAPEALRYSRFTTKSDMWAFGVLLWEIYSYGRVPYPRIPIADVVRHIEKGYRMEPPEGCLPSLAQCMADAWALQPDRRPTFAAMLRTLTGIERTVAAAAAGDAAAAGAGGAEPTNGQLPGKEVLTIGVQ